MVDKPKRKRRKRTKNYYFTQVHEDAIIKYAKTNDNIERTKLYVEFIQPAFNELVDKITFTYKFTTLPNVDSLRDECKIWLTTILDKYNPDKGSKAFSYFSVVTKNWFIHKVKKTSQRRKREIQLDDVIKYAEAQFISEEHQYEKNREKKEFWKFLMKELDDWEWTEEDLNIKSNEVRVIRAIKELLKDPKEVEILNKKAIYLYLREITGLNTKQIANCLKKFREKYRSFKVDWEKGQI